MKRQRILFLSHYAANPQFQEFFTEIAKLGSYEVKVVLPREIIYTNGYRPQRWPKRKVLNGVEYIPANLIDPKRYYLSGYRPELGQTIERFRPDTVIVTDEVYTMDTFNVILYRLLYLRRFQIITWCQALYMEKPKTVRWPGPLLLWWNKKFVSKFVARNTHQAGRIRAVIPQSKQVQHVYWSTNPTEFKTLKQSRKDLLKKFGLETLPIEDKRLIGFVGRLVPEKSILEVASVLSKLPKDVVFLVVGQGDEKYIAEIKSYLKQNNLEDRCYLVGDRPYNELVYFYNLLEVLLLPTRNYNNFYELFGRVLAEGMMSKTLVLGSSNGAIPEVINNPDCLFKQNDWEDFTNKLIRLLNLPKGKREAMIEDNYRHSITNFTVEAFAKNLISLIER